MPKNIRYLTDEVAERTRPATDKKTGKTKDAFLWDTKLKGYGLICRKSGVKVWIYQREVRGKTARQLLGHYPAMREETARKDALKAFADMGGGFNPHEARDARITAARNGIGSWTDRFVDACTPLSQEQPAPSQEAPRAGLPAHQGTRAGCRRARRVREALIVPSSPRKRRNSSGNSFFTMRRTTHVGGFERCRLRSASGAP